MSISGKRYMALFLVFCLVALSGNLTAQQARKGVQLSVEQNDGKIVKGELITVKKDSLLLLDSETQADLSLPITAVKTIAIHNKHKMFELGLIGALLGAAVQGLGGTDIKSGSVEQGGLGNEEASQNVTGFLEYGAIGGGAGVLIGAVIGIDKKIQIQGRSDADIQKDLEKLSKKARVRGIQ